MVGLVWENLEQWISRQEGEGESIGCIRTTDLVYHQKASNLKLFFETKKNGDET